MKRNLLTFATTILMGLSSLIAQTIIVQDAEGNNARLYTDLETAVNGANSGDYLYLSGGTYDITSTWKGYDGKGSYTNYLVIDKPLHFVGAGYRQGADTPYIKGGRFAFRKSASGSSVTGLLMENLYLDSVSNARISRSKVSNHLYLCGVGLNGIITECELYSITNLYNFTNLSGDAYYSYTISKNIIENQNIGNGGLYNATIKNNIVRMYISAKNSTIENNIVLNPNKTSTTIGGENSVVRNNILLYDKIALGQGGDYSGNMEELNPEDVFMDFANKDYRLKETCPGKNAGTDGTDIGIYGTEYPFKDSRIPSIPCFLNKSIASETEADGKLKVNITIEAQER
ncbi:hypothetical protein LJC16_01625 [Bacteroidales bacterium OttesenSCG-928-C19]|nr:hypothetical protein [Bacteroidales bacterium OttesenSCG-928-C19]